jgi:hypothetical protein
MNLLGALSESSHRYATPGHRQPTPAPAPSAHLGASGEGVPGAVGNDRRRFLSNRTVRGTPTYAGEAGPCATTRLLRGLLFGFGSSVTSDAEEKLPDRRRADSL